MKRSEGVDFPFGGWIEESFATDRPRPGSAFTGAAPVVDRVILGLELAQAATDLVRGVFRRDVLVARSRVESAALAGAVGSEVQRDAGGPGQIGGDTV